MLQTIIEFFFMSQKNSTSTATNKRSSMRFSASSNAKIKSISNLRETSVSHQLIHISLKFLCGEIDVSKTLFNLEGFFFLNTCTRFLTSDFSVF